MLKLKLKTLSLNFKKLENWQAYTPQRWEINWPKLQGAEIPKLGRDLFPYRSWICVSEDKTLRVKINHY